MSDKELRQWGDWTDPDFFTAGKQTESRAWRLFARQLVSTKVQSTKLTTVGWMLILVSLGIGTAAYNTASNILFMTLSLLLSSLVLSGILSLVNFKKLEWDLKIPPHTRAGELALAEIDLRNDKSMFPSLCLKFGIGHSETNSKEFLHLHDAVDAGATTSTSWAFSPKKRGGCLVTLSGAESKFPFGFISKRVGAELIKETIVWPARVDYRLEPNQHGHQLTSGRTQNRSGQGNELLKIRDYIPGDAPRLIHWKASARMNRLVIRELAQEGNSGFHLNIEHDREFWSEKQFESLCSLASSLAEDLFHEERLESVMIKGRERIIVKSMRELHFVFDELAKLEPECLEENNPSLRRNQISFRPKGDTGVAIYVDGTRTGETDD